MQLGLNQFKDNTFQVNTVKLRKEMCDWICINEELCSSNLKIRSKIKYKKCV